MPRNKDLLPLTEPAQRIWLAGLGAFAMAGEEGGKLFETLVRKGRTLEKANLARLDTAMGTVEERLETLRALPATTAERISDGFEGGVATVLHRLGVPTKREIGTLTRRVEELSKNLTRKPTVRRSRPRVRRTTARKPVATA